MWKVQLHSDARKTCPLENAILTIPKKGEPTCIPRVLKEKKPGKWERGVWQLSLLIACTCIHTGFVYLGLIRIDHA